jgi:small subunit ribosomal protein S31
MEREASVPFHEHVFLEPKIDSWCPKQGPVRQFMELVCVALSKNPFLSVVEKEEYLEWYHTYFKGKAQILKEVGAGEIH